MGPSTKTTSRGNSQKKPYEQRLSAAAKGKAKAVTDLGAPATHSQASRKGKKAWRKNVDIRTEEQALEQAREEERQTGGRVESQSNEQLFVVDSTGDEKVAQRLRKELPPRRSLAILNERSAVPSLTSKIVASSSAPFKQRVTAADKERLLRIARKKVIGSGGEGLGSAVITAGPAARGENLRDVWSEVDYIPEPVEGEWGREGKPPPKPKAPKALQRQRDLVVQQTHKKALPVPHEGLSYNPRLESHQELLDRAVQEELARLQKEDEEQKRIQRASGFVVQPEYIPGVPLGMKVGDGDETTLDVDVDIEVESSEEVAIKPQKRKTQADRNKAHRAREARRSAVLKESSKRLRDSLSLLPSITAKVKTELSAKEKIVADRAAARLVRAQKGLDGGEKIGKYKVKAGNVDVQLEEDLTENLRGLKPEGNLFRDRFLSLQQRALIEPRVPQLPKSRTHRIKEYEKHAWKRFE